MEILLKRLLDDDCVFTANMPRVTNQSPRPSLSIAPDGFKLGGAPFRLIGGAIHYFRVPPAYWRDRLTKLKALGANTVETYVAWNAHEPKQGKFNFDGMLDVVGNTDDVPVGRELAARYPTNWELAGERASVVVRRLQEKGVPPGALRSVSNGQYHPIASNTSPTGRAQNRRTEILLRPR